MLCFLWPARGVRRTTCWKRVLQGVRSHHISINPLQESCTWENVCQRSITGIGISGAATWWTSPVCNLSHSAAVTGGWALVLIFNRSGGVFRLRFRPVQVWLKGNGGVIASSNLLNRKLLVGVWAAASAASARQLIGQGKHVQHLFTWSGLQQPQKGWFKTVFC